MGPGYEITGEPYPEGDVWYLPTVLKMADGKTEPQTIMIKFYDFDGTWHQWAGDFLLACDWLLENHQTHRVRVALAAVNW